MALQAGDLRSRVGFYQRATVADEPDYGNTESEFPTDAEFTCAANIKPRLGGEAVLAARLTGTNFANITVRSSASTRLVDTSWQVKDERSGVPYNIRSVIDPFEGSPADHGKYLEMLCEKGVAVDNTADSSSTSTFSLDFTDAANSGYVALLEDI